MRNYNYDRNDVYRESTQLPKGAYVGKILAIKWEEGKNGNSDMLKFSFDIVEGEHAKYFENAYKSDTREDKKWRGVFVLFCPLNDGSEKDGWTRKKFNTAIAAIEDSNPGFHFDGTNEGCLKDKLVGLNFRNKEYKKNDGSIGTTTECGAFVAAQSVRDGSVRLLDDKVIAKNAPASGFMDVPTGGSDELPFA